MIKDIKELYEIIQPDFLINQIENKILLKINWKEIDLDWVQTKEYGEEMGGGFSGGGTGAKY